MMSSNATEKLFRLLGSPSSPRLFTQSLEQHGHARQNKRQCPSETLNFGIDVANNPFPPQNYQRKVFFDRLCERLCPCSFSGQYTFTNDMSLSAKYIARIFFSFWLRNALDQLSEDFVTNASSLFAYPPPPRQKIPFDLQQFYLKYANCSIFRKKRTKQQPKITCTSTRIKLWLFVVTIKRVYLKFMLLL